MSYCKFENTLKALEECVHPEGDTNDIYTKSKENSSFEQKARLELIELCKEVAFEV